MTVRELIKKLIDLPDQDREVVGWYSKYSEHITPMNGISGEDEDLYMTGDGYMLDQAEMDSAREENEDDDWGDDYSKVYILS